MKYKIWNKTDSFYTPSGVVLTPEQLITQYPICNLPQAKIVVADQLINGAFFGELSQMKEIYAKNGVDFSTCVTDEDVLNAITAWEERPIEVTPSADERIAAALEFQNLMAMPDIDGV